MDDDEFWTGDDEGEILPVLDIGEEGAIPPPDRTRRARRRPAPPKGVPMSSVPEVRRANLAAATGRARAEPEQWREEMAAGNRDRAASTLENGGRRSSGGFGLA